MIIDSNKIPINFLLVLILLTSLRNFSVIYYIILASLFLYFIIKNLPKMFKINLIHWNFYLFYFYAIYISIFSILYTEGINSYNLINENYIVGISRFLLMPTFGFILLNELKNKKQFYLVLKIIILIYLLGALSLLWQVQFGAIDWFSNTHMRGGYIRYSSILGSLSIYGSITGFAIILIFNNSLVTKNLYKFILFLVIIAASIASLTKTGIFLIIIALILLILSSLLKIKFKNFILGISVIGFLIFVTIYFISLSEFASKYTNTVINFTFGFRLPILNSNSQVLINDTPNISYELIYKRITYFAESAFRYYGSIVMITGAGVWGGSGVLGFNHGSSPHSGLLDLIMIGGPIFLLIFFVIFFKIQIYFYMNLNDDLNKLFFLSNLLFFLNMIFISGSLFNPSISILFWVSLIYYINQKKNINYENNELGNLK